MTGTHVMFQHIQELLKEPGNASVAWQWFQKALQESYEAGYDAGAQDTEYDHNQAMEN